MREIVFCFFVDGAALDGRFLELTLATDIAQFLRKIKNTWGVGEKFCGFLFFVYY
jgi:hypothetical protein